MEHHPLSQPGIEQQTERSNPAKWLVMMLIKGDLLALPADGSVERVEDLARHAIALGVEQAKAASGPAEQVCKELREILRLPIAEADWSRITYLLQAWMTHIPAQVRDARSPIEKQKAMLLPVTKLKVSRRALKAFKALEVHTIGDLTCVTKEQLFGCFGVGWCTYDEVIKALAALGLSLFPSAFPDPRSQE
jgi:hypothetical protein